MRFPMVTNTTTDRTSKMCCHDITTYTVFGWVVIPAWHNSSLPGSVEKQHRLRRCRVENDCSVIFPASLSPWAIMEWLLICLDNMKGAGALISIKTAIGLNYLYDCPLELLSMLSPYPSSQSTTPLQEVYVRRIQCSQLTHHKRALH